jgi:hypothetical protein
MDVPVRELQVSIDQDTWPGTGILDRLSPTSTAEQTLGVR